MNAYEIAIGIGFCIAALWVLAYVLCWVGQWAWAWIDDSEVGKRNKIVDLIHFRHGYKIRLCGYATDFPYGHNKYSDACGLALWSTYLVLLLLSPLTVVAVIDFYSVSLVVMAFATAAYLARFTLRHKKLFDKHVVSKEAHK